MALSFDLSKLAAADVLRQGTSPEGFKQFIESPLENPIDNCFDAEGVCWCLTLDGCRGVPHTCEVILS